MVVLLVTYNIICMRVMSKVLNLGVLFLIRSIVYILHSDAAMTL